MARSRENRPVFGELAQKEREVERFVLDEDELVDHVYEKPTALSWTSWIATISLVLMLVESGVSEIRRYTRVDGTLEVHRRL